MADPVPVLMYHSIAPPIEGWAFSYLSIHPDVFEDHISTLAAAGYVPILLPDLFDGYLDNWVFAFPVLRKHGFRGTVFASTDFIDRRDIVRPNSDDVREGRARPDGLRWNGFLSAAEIRRMLLSEVMDVQGHCKTHTWYFTSPEIIDFHHPGDPYPWLAWNARPERKHLYLEEDQSGFVPLGTPVYAHDRAVTARRYFPDPGRATELSAFVRANGGSGFFEGKDWRNELRNVSAAVHRDARTDRYETEAERLTRLREEIALSRRELEGLVNKKVDFLCWPGGAYDETALEVAREAGYLAWTLSSRDRRARKNVPGENPAWIHRTAAVPWWYFRGRRVCAVDGDFLKRMIEAYRGAALAGLRLKWLKLGRLIGSYFG
jgi:peptidoglycan/xylan/chitin deacetylase (PgdA/CDA1 family)